MYDFRIGNDLCGKYAILIAGFRRHQTVGGEQDRCRKVRKFLLLVLPGGTEIAFKMRILLKLRISMCGKHLAVGIDIDSFVLCLFKQLLQIIEIMAGDYDKGSFFHHQRHCHRSGAAIGPGIGLVKHCHAIEVVLADFQNDGQQFIHAPVLADGEERPGKKFIYRLISVSKDTGMISICRHTPDAKQDQ